LLGNDVVDLGDPETAEAALHPRFDARVFAPAERAQLAASRERARLRFVLWAAKEAAWKAARRSGLTLPFHPAAVETALRPAREGGFEGAATLAGAAFAVRVEVSGDAVHAVARAPSLAPTRLVASLGRLHGAGPTAESAGARALALDLASAALAAPRAAPGAPRAAPGALRAALAIVSSGRLPELRLAGHPVEAVLSLAHHGRFAAAAIALPARCAPRAA
jgi:phosphopantetheinyl transferase (holo-ACP synthase)